MHAVLYSTLAHFTCMSLAVMMVAFFNTVIERGMKLLGLYTAALLIGVGYCMKESEKHGNPIHSKHYEEDGEHDDDYDHEAILGNLF